MCGWGCGKREAGHGEGAGRDEGGRCEGVGCEEGPDMARGPDARMASGPLCGRGGQPTTAWASISTSIGSCGSSTKTVVRHGFTPPGLTFSSMNSA